MRGVEAPRGLKTALHVACLFAACVAVLTAGQPWKKNPAKWSKADAQRILNASPWAKRVQVQFPKPERISRPMPLPGPAQAGLGSRGNPTSTNWDPVEKNPKNLPGVPELSVLVRWASALPVRKALDRLDHPLVSSANPEDVQASYIIEVIGLVPAGSYNSEGRLPSRPTTSASRKPVTNKRNPEPMIEGLMADSILVTGSHLAIRPVNVRLDAATGVLQFFFPRDKPIVLTDQEAIFQTKFGIMKVKKRFRLKDMVVRGKLEL
ncbi:MAG: hypothetical protein ACRD6B_10070 [Bryobacteraceae bacterium]